MDVAGPSEPVAPQGGVRFEPVRAGVVEGEPAPVGGDQVDGAAGARGVRRERRGDAVVLEGGADEGALGVVPDHVHYRRTHSQGVGAADDAVPRVPEECAHGGHHQGVRLGEGERGDAHHGVDADASDDQDIEGFHGPTVADGGVCCRALGGRAPSAPDLSASARTWTRG